MNETETECIFRHAFSKLGMCVGVGVLIWVEWELKISTFFFLGKLCFFFRVRFASVLSSVIDCRIIYTYVK